jgi:hypothetical protein
MIDLNEPDGLDIVAPRQPVVISLEISPEDVELALATNADSLRQQLLMALIVELATSPLVWADKANDAESQKIESLNERRTDEGTHQLKMVATPRNPIGSSRARDL